MKNNFLSDFFVDFFLENFDYVKKINSIFVENFHFNCHKIQFYWTRQTTPKIPFSWPKNKILFRETFCKNVPIYIFQKCCSEISKNQKKNRKKRVENRYLLGQKNYPHFQPLHVFGEARREIIIFFSICFSNFFFMNFYDFFYVFQTLNPTSCNR